MSAPVYAYFAYPIDQAGSGAAKLAEEVERCKQVALGRGVIDVAYDPGDAFSISSMSMSKDGRLSQINNHALDQCDVVWAWLPADVASVGVPMEIQRAQMFAKHVVVMTDAPSWAILGGDDRTFVCKIDDPEAAMAWLKGVSELIDQRGSDEGKEVMMVKRLNPESQVPTRAYLDDAGYDLYVVGDHNIKPGEFVDVPVGVAVALPPGLWAMLTGRSSTLRNFRLLVTTGIIDTGYRGPLFAGVQNVGEVARRVEHGTRIAQLILLPNATAWSTPVEVDTLPNTSRGSQGFGSSGS